MNLSYTKNSRSCGIGKVPILYKALFVCFFGIFSFSLHSQENVEYTEFCWFVVPDAAQAHDDQPVFFMITAGAKDALVKISMPANSSFPVQTKSLAPYESWKITYGDHIGNPEGFRGEMDLLENPISKAGQPTNKGILISSTASISAYYQLDGHKSGQKEIFTLKGEKALGSEFYTPFQTKYLLSTRWDSDKQVFRQIHIVAVDDNTNVTFKAPSDLANTYISNGIFAKNLEHTVSLNRGQTLLLRENVKGSGLMGTHIKTTDGKRIAVTVFEDCVDSQGQDPIGDQIVPINNVGTSYIVVKGYTKYNNDNNKIKNTVDHVYILATQNSTTVKVGGVDKGTIDAGQYLYFDIDDGNTNPQAYYFETSKPAYCFHQSAVVGEVGGALIPSMYSISSRKISFYNQALSINSIFLIYRESGKSSFKIKYQGKEEKNLSVNEGSVGVDGWLYSKQNLDKEEGTTTISNDEGAFALGYFASPGGGTTSLYGYLSNFGAFSLGGDTLYVCGKSHTFDGGYAKGHTWTDPDDIVTTGPTFTATKSGKYKLVRNLDPIPEVVETYLKLQNFEKANLSAPKQLLVDKTYNFTIKLDKSDKDNIFDVGYEWIFGDGASVATSSANMVTVSYSTPGIKTVTLKIKNKDAGCETTITANVEVLDASQGKVMYWKKDAKNPDWNNVNNWAKDAEGTPLPVIPAKHTRVYLPYLPDNANNYPNLEDGYTDWTHYEQPEVNEIVFRYGSELHYQHLLKYNKAYINYNWGYYDGKFNNEQPSKSWENAKKLSRNTWYILAAPLKEMASGDFSLTGRPFSWQKKFQTTTLQDGVIEGGFSSAFADNAVPLAKNNNAIAVKMAGYNTQTGYQDQTYLENLKGVIEIPYFENSSIALSYPGHSYDALSEISNFYYFDTQTLKLLNSPVSSMSRGDKAYRFVYETEDNSVPTNNMYKLALNAESISATGEVMVGNPFLSPIYAWAFYKENEAVINYDAGFKLLSEDKANWERKEYNGEGGDQMIPAWRAFIVTLKENPSGTSKSASINTLSTKGTPSGIVLSFPLETYPMPRSASVRARASYLDFVNSALSVQILKEGVASGDAAELRSNPDGNSSDIRKMILPEGHAVPEVFFIDSEEGTSNLIQNYKPGQKEVAIGVKTSDVHSRLSLQFKNVPMFTATTGAKAVLVDKYLNIKQDLARSATYGFTQRATGLDKQSVDKTRFVLQLGNETTVQEDSENGIHVFYRSGVLQISSDETIDAVAVYDSQGRLVYSAHSIGRTEYTYSISLKGGIFVVQVKTASGKSKAEKITGY